MLYFYQKIEYLEKIFEIIINGGKVCRAPDCPNLKVFHLSRDIIVSRVYSKIDIQLTARYIEYFHLCVVHSVSVWPYGSNLIEWDLSPLGRILSCRARDTVCGVGESEENKDEGENSEDEMSV